LEFDDEITPTAVEALDVYVGLMSDWADAATAGTSLDEVFPVDAEPTMATSSSCDGGCRSFAIA
jgi:hypothetical protein